MSLKVSVVMPVYNREKYLAEAIESILEQSISDLELIVVDDGSRDGSYEMARAYGRHDERLRCIKLDRNMGVSAARNRGMAASVGEYIAFMDSDDVSLPDRLDKQAGIMERNGKIGVVSACTNIMNEDMSVLLTPKSVPALHPNIVLSLLIGAPCIVAGAMMVRASLARKAGGWNESLRAGEEEGDYYMRLLLHGARFANVNEILYLQRKHDSNATWSADGLSMRYVDRRRKILSELLERIDEETVKRFKRFAYGEKLNRGDRRLVKRDLRLFIERIVDQGFVMPEEESVMIADMNRRLEEASPRYWQMFCHWRRARGLAND